MEIKKYTVSDLKAQLNTNELWEQDTIAINRQKAISFVTNPRASENDVVLLTGYHNNDVIGYISIVPDLIYPADTDSPEKFGWLGALWVNPEREYSMLTLKFLLQAFQLYNNQIGESIATPKVIKIFKTSGKFIPLKTVTGKTFIIKSNLYYWLPRKFNFLKPISGLIKITDHFIDAIYWPGYSFWKKKNTLKTIKLEYISQITDQTTKTFIDNHNKKDLTRKTWKEINWMVLNPSALATPLKDHIKSRYYFTIKGTRHYFHMIKVLNSSNVLVGLMIIEVTGNQLTLPYCTYEEEYLNEITKIFVHHIFILKAEMITIYNQDILNSLKVLKFPSIIKKDRLKESLISKKFKDIRFNGCTMHDGDGA